MRCFRYVFWGPVIPSEQVALVEEKSGILVPKCRAKRFKKAFFDMFFGVFIASHENISSGICHPKNGLRLLVDLKLSLEMDTVSMENFWIRLG